MPQFKLGERVLFSDPLKRVTPQGAHWDTRVWLPEPTYPWSYPPVPQEGIVIGLRTLQDGQRISNGPDEPLEWHASERFTAYIIAFDLRRKPALVRPENITSLENES